MPRPDGWTGADLGRAGLREPMPSEDSPSFPSPQGFPLQPNRWPLGVLAVTDVTWQE